MALIMHTKELFSKPCSANNKKRYCCNVFLLFTMNEYVFFFIFNNKLLKAYIANIRQRFYYFKT